MIREIQEELVRRDIRRLCHFTPSRNLQHIAAGKVGVLATSKLEQEERSAFNPTDLARYDRHTGHICCSIEYPNGWYFEKARDKEPLFQDWVVLLLKPEILAREGTLFSPGNAARGGGRNLAPGAAAFSALFAPTVAGSTGNYVRTPSVLPACPTDQQAEVLVEDCIPMADITAVAVESEKQGLTELARLRANGILGSGLKFVVAPHLFNKYQLNHIIQRGTRPPEPELQVRAASGADIK